MQRISIVSEEHRRRVQTIIAALPLAPVMEVVIRERKKDRSADQNALYWQWLTIIGNELGESKESVHERMKDSYLVQIYERDNPEYAEMVQALREVWKHGMKVEAVALRKRIVALTSTTTATTAQMGEYLNCIELSAAELAIKLPFPG